MTDYRRLDLCWALSLSFHMAALGGYILFKMQHKQNLTVLSDVEFIEPEPPKSIEEPSPSPLERAPKNMLEFLKMALPQIKKQTLQEEIKLPQPKESLAPLPEQKIELKKGLLQAQSAIELDKRSNQKAPSLAEVNAESTKNLKSDSAQLAEAPIQLEEVGKVAVKLPKAAFDAPVELRRSSRLQEQSLPIQTAPSPRGQSSLQEAPIALAKGPAQAPSSFQSGDGAALSLGYSKRGSLREEYAPTAKGSSLPAVTQTRKTSNKELEGLESSRKSVELSGPISSRKILQTKLPEYPKWARQQGISADVVLQFYVSAQGSVRGRIKITRTSGYSELDQRAIEALKFWLFEPLPNQKEDQWGFVTFRYVLE